MKVLFVSSGNAKNGISPIIQNQSRSIINQGVSVDFFSIKGKGLITYLKHIFILRNYLKKNNYSIIHAHYGFCGIVALSARRKEKVVVSFMGDDLLGSVNKNGKTSLSSFLGSLINKFLAKYYFDFNIVKSENLKNSLFNKTKARIIPNGVDFLQFYPIDKTEAKKELGIPLDQRIVLFASDPDRMEKNYTLAEQSIKLLSDSKVILKAVYNESQQKLNKYYNASDVILLTSFHEGSPNIIKEAMACNCVIVSTDVGDVRQNIQQVEGCFICSFDPKDVAEKICIALKKEKSTGRENISDLDSNVVANKIINIYDTLLR